MQQIDGSGSFEEAATRICAELKATCEMAEALVDRVVRIAGPGELPEATSVAAFDDGCKAMIARQTIAHAMLAGQIAEIAASVDDARAALDTSDVPRRSDLWLGRISKRLMRRRMAARSGRPAQGDRLLQMLGRCDRLAGIIETYRSDARGHRDRAEVALSDLYRRGEDNGAEALDRMAVSSSAFVDALNRAIGDHTVFLNKLTFDVEHALEVYNVLADMGLVKDTLSEAETYPHFGASIERLADGILPGGRLARARQSADRAFAERFAKA